MFLFYYKINYNLINQIYVNFATSFAVSESTEIIQSFEEF